MRSGSFENNVTKNCSLTNYNIYIYIYIYSVIHRQTVSLYHIYIYIYIYIYMYEIYTISFQILSYEHLKLS